ncbi:hypothetical protein [Rhodococcus sp. NPDC047139]|uniref:RNA polymerase factor sigma-54 n=1 Tax=Rhodococcus sp. NPDC047139 TaxID=3155141 RepID=UPI0033EAA984
MAVTTAVLQTLTLLPAAHAEVDAAVDAALALNPMLERRDGMPCVGCGRHCQSGRCVRCARDGIAAAAAAEPTVDPFRTLEVAAGMEISSACRGALPLVMAHLTDRGLLDSEPDEIAALHGLTTATVAEALRALRVVGPPGIGETTTIGLLTAQARMLRDDGTAPDWFVTLVQDHLDLIGGEDFAAAADILGVTEEEVRHAAALIRSRLRPFAAIGSSTPEPRSQPDVFVRYDSSETLQVEVPDSAWFGLRVTPLAPYIGATSEARKWLAPHDAAARRLLHQLDARADVLTRVAGLAIERQRAYIAHGPTAHLPLTRTEVAHSLGLHPSTVSRAVRGKCLRLPSGQVMDLANLFGKSVAARAHLSALAAQRSDLPRNDRALRGLLADVGVDVARRTVAKYRAQLGIQAQTSGSSRS